MSSAYTCVSCGISLKELTHLSLCPSCLHSTVAPAGRPTDVADDPRTAVDASSDLDVGTYRYLQKKGYRAERRLGAGGYGVVYLARDPADRPVAVKVLHSYLASAKILARFESEAKALATLDHPGLVRLHHYSADPEAPFLVTEFVPGGTLASRLKAEGPFDPAEAARLMEKVSRLVQHLHARGVIHRDLKPSNILLDASGEPKVGDFGLAKRLTADEPLTRTGSFAGGTPEFCAPEQFRADGEADHRADVYALGAVLYTLLIGRPPFRRRSDDEYGIAVQEQVKSARPVPPSDIRPEVPAGLATICLKALEKVPADRYQSADEFADELRRVLAGERPLARPTSWFTRVRRRAAEVPKRWVALALLLAIFSGGIGAAIPYRLRNTSSGNPVAEALKANKPIDLIPEYGMPVSSRWLLGEAALPERTSEQDPFSFSTYPPAMLSLCDDPGVDSFRITAVLKQVDCQSRVKNLDVSLDYVGVFWGFRGGKFPNGYTMTCHPSVHFADFQPHPDKQLVQHSMIAKVKGYGAVPLGDIGGHESKYFADTPLDPEPELPGPWRTIQIDVTPAAITYHMPDGPVVVPAAQFLSEVSNFEQGAVENFRRNIGFQPYTHRAPLGVFSWGSHVAVKRFTLSPIPAE